MTSSPSISSVVGAVLALFTAVFIARLGAHQILSWFDTPPPLLWTALAEAGLLAGVSMVILARPLQLWRHLEADRIFALRARLAQAAQRQAFSAELTTALGQSVDEDEARWVIRRALDQISPQAPIELLLTEPEGARLQRTVVGGGFHASFGCPVKTSGACPAMRSGKARAGASTDLDACRMLAERDTPGHGLCVPVTINGQALGVLHTAPSAPPTAEVHERLPIVAEQAGVRLGLFRVMAATRHAATTDELTGLLNRRALMSQIESLTAASDTYALALADIDQFKSLNDTYGHAVGDRALQTFARAVQEAVRAEDIVARFGGEEFVIVLPGLSAERGLEVIARIQLALPRALSRDNLPGFTASFGLADARHGGDLETRLRAADAALYAAKRAGRDRACLAETPETTALRRAI